MDCSLISIALATSIAMGYEARYWRKTSSKSFNCRWYHPFPHIRIIPCGDSLCYFNEAGCDSVIDCPSSRDEMNCNPHGKWKTKCDEIRRDAKGLGFFQCKNQMCIYGCQRCDGMFQNCTDGSDEDVEHGGCNNSTNKPDKETCKNFKGR